MHDLAIIVVSTNEASWLEPCLRTVFAHRGDATLDVVVADNESTDGTAELVGEGFPDARVVRCPNRGFAHANNRALATTDSRFALFLNPDTEVVKGDFGTLVELMDERPEVGLVGVRQLTSDGTVFPTIRRFPNAARQLAEALGSERLGYTGRWLGERELASEPYERETRCDWTSGSFMLARREALDSAGWLDERFFIYSEETDLCYRIKEAGWDVLHLPQMTIVHHAGKGGVNPKMEAQGAFARRQYAQKHFSPFHRGAFLAALALRYLLRGVAGGFDRSVAGPQRAASRRALRTLFGLRPPPFGEPPATAVAPRRSTE